MIKIPKRLNLPCCNIPSLWMKIGGKKKQQPENSPGLFHILNCWAPRTLRIDFFFFPQATCYRLSSASLSQEISWNMPKHSRDIKPDKECTCKTIFAGMISPSVAIFLLTYLDLYHFRITKDKYFMNLKITYPSCIPSLWCKSRLARPIWNVLGWNEEFVWFAFKASNTFWVKS